MRKSGARRQSGVNTPRRIRTFNLRFRRPMLYPVELWVHGEPVALRDWHHRRGRRGVSTRAGLAGRIAGICAAVRGLCRFSHARPDNRRRASCRPHLSDRPRRGRTRLRTATIGPCAIGNKEVPVTVRKLFPLAAAARPVGRRRRPRPRPTRPRRRPSQGREPEARPTPSPTKLPSRAARLPRAADGRHQSHWTASSTCHGTCRDRGPAARRSCRRLRKVPGVKRIESGIMTAISDGPAAGGQSQDWPRRRIPAAAGRLRHSPAGRRSPCRRRPGRWLGAGAPASRPR